MDRICEALKDVGKVILRIKSRNAITKIQAAIMVALITVISVAAVWYYYSTTTTSKEITIGVILPLSGSMATIGLTSQQGHDLAVEDINAAGGIKSLGGTRIKLVYADLQSDPTVAVTETERLITTYNPVAIVGAYASSLAIPASLVTEQHKVPFLATVSQADTLTDRGLKYVFRQMQRASNVGTIPIDVVVDMAERYGTPINTVALLFENSVAMQIQQEKARTRATELGLTVVYDEAYSPDISDFSPVVTKLKAANPDVLVTFSFLNDAILLATTIKEMGFYVKGYVSTGGGYLEPDFIDSAGEAAEYIFAGSGWQRDLNIEGMADVVARYEEKYGTFMNEHAGLSYTATWLVKEAIELSGSLHPDNALDPESVRDAFTKMDISSGPAVMNAGGRAKFDENGDNIYATYVYLQILNGTQYSVWPFDRASTEAVWPVPNWSERE